MLANGRALASDTAEGYVEIITDQNSGKILGAVCIGAHVSEFISTITLALEAEMTVEQFQKVIFPHPTISESLAEALAK